MKGLVSSLQIRGATKFYAAKIDSILFSAQPSPTSPPVLPYISLGSTAGVQREYVGHFDDGVSHAIHIPGGFPFGNLIHSFAYVSAMTENKVHGQISKIHHHHTILCI